MRAGRKVREVVIIYRKEINTFYILYHRENGHINYCEQM